MIHGNQRLTTGERQTEENTMVTHVHTHNKACCCKRVFGVLFCSARQPHLECTTEDQHNIINPIHDLCTEQFRSLRRHLAQSLTLNITLLYYDTNSGLTEFRIHQKKNKNPQHRWCVAVAFVKALPLCVVNPVLSIYLSLSTAYQQQQHIIIIIIIMNRLVSSSLWLWLWLNCGRTTAWTSSRSSTFTGVALPSLTKTKTTSSSSSSSSSQHNLVMYDQRGDPPHKKKNAPLNAWNVLADTEAWISATLQASHDAAQQQGRPNPYTRKEVSYVCETAVDQAMITAGIFRRLKEARWLGQRHGTTENERAAQQGE